MNDEIRKIVRGYIDQGEYEKALSLLKNISSDEEQDKILLQECTDKYKISCTTAITEAVKNKDRRTAENILSSYVKLIGEDTNTTLFRTLTESIKTEPENKTAETIKQLSNLDYSSVFKGCTPSAEFLESKIMGITYAILALFSIILGCFGGDMVLFYLCTFLPILALGVPTLYSPNRKFRTFGSMLLVISIILALIAIGIRSDSSLVLFFVIWAIEILVYNTLLPKVGIIGRIVYSLAIPLLFFLSSVYADKTDTEHLTGFPQLALLLIFYGSFIGFKNLWNKLTERIVPVIRRNKKKILISLGAVVGVVVLCFVIGAIKADHDHKIAVKEAREKAVRDSIQAVENARIAAIEKARQDSIDHVRMLEQARRDSIDYAEHAGFVAKYANLGLIITDIEVEKGYHDGESTKGPKFTVFNPTNKTIKYVIVTAAPLNRFKDQVGYTQRFRGIGPVAPHEFGSWSFSDAFPDKNDVIEDLNISFRVEYTNGSAKNVKLSDVRINSNDFKTSWFEGR